MNEQIYSFNENLEKTYQRVLTQIQLMQEDIKRSERKARKKAKKKMDGNPSFYKNNCALEARKKVLTEIESDNGSFFDVVIRAIQDAKGICILIARMVSILIVSLLSMDSFIAFIKPQTLEKIKGIYAIASKV